LQCGRVIIKIRALASHVEAQTLDRKTRIKHLFYQRRRIGTPLVLIFGFTNPARVGPYARGQTVAAVDADKRGSQVESSNTAHDIKNVSVETVFEIISRQLG